MKDGAPFAFAGLWEAKTRAPQDTFTILNCAPNELCAQVHDRMPIVLAPEDWPRWLATPPERMKLFRPYNAKRMQMWPVSKKVGKKRHARSRRARRNHDLARDGGRGLAEASSHSVPAFNDVRLASHSVSLTGLGLSLVDGITAMASENNQQRFVTVLLSAARRWGQARALHGNAR
jgi:hypothetical protein